jgi:hypothetical protein
VLDQFTSIFAHLSENAAGYCICDIINISLIFKKLLLFV